MGKLRVENNKALPIHHAWSEQRRCFMMVLYSDKRSAVSRQLSAKKRRYAS
jgi:hypothetical protein